MTVVEEAPTRGRPKGTKVTPDARRNITAGIVRGKAIKRFLAALGAQGDPKLRERLAELETEAMELAAEIDSTESMRRLTLRARLHDAVAERDRLRDAVNGASPEELAELTALFVEHAKVYAESKGWGELAWAIYRAEGVSVDTLKAAGLEPNANQSMAMVKPEYARRKRRNASDGDDS